MKTTANRSGPRRAAASNPPSTPPQPRHVLVCLNRQRARRINIALLRRITDIMLKDLLDGRDCELSVCLVGAPEITRVNETFLRHKGVTDVITFDYSEHGRSERLCGEVIVCLEQAVVQARQFGATWQSEIVRCVVHGLLHLCGFDDRGTADRRRMKLAEGRLLQKLARQFDFRKLGLP